MEQTSVEKDDQDSPWKKALDDYFQPFLELLFPKVAEAIDWNQPTQSLNTELQELAIDNAGGKRYADKLMEVTLLNGGQEWLLIHIEVQGNSQARFNERMFHYHFRIWDKYQKQVLSLAVLTDSNKSFRPGCYQQQLTHLGQELSFRFPAVKLLDWMDRLDKLEQNSNPFAVVVLAQLQVMRYRKDQHQERLAVRLRLAKLLLQRNYGKDRIAELLQLVEWLLTLPKALEDDYIEQVRLLKEEPQMSYVSALERLSKEEGIAEERRRAEAEIQRIKAEKQQFARASINKFIELGMSLAQAAETLGISEEEARKIIQS